MKTKAELWADFKGWWEPVHVGYLAIYCFAISGIPRALRLLPGLESLPSETGLEHAYYLIGGYSGLIFILLAIGWFYATMIYGIIQWSWKVYHAKEKRE